MLNKKTLQDEIQNAVESILPNALEQGLRATFPRNSKSADELAKKFADVATEQFAKPFAISMASAIDYYIRTADIYGTLNTTGSPTSHICLIESPTPITNGRMINTLGIK